MFIYFILLFFYYYLEGKAQGTNIPAICHLNLWLIPLKIHYSLLIFIHKKTLHCLFSTDSDGSRSQLCLLLQHAAQFLGTEWAFIKYLFYAVIKRAKKTPGNQVQLVILEDLANFISSFFSSLRMAYFKLSSALDVLVKNFDSSRTSMILKYHLEKHFPPWNAAFIESLN